MTLRCSGCDCTDVELVDDNGAEYPEIRVEFYECRGCGNRWRQVLTP